MKRVKIENISLTHHGEQIVVDSATGTYSYTKKDLSFPAMELACFAASRIEALQAENCALSEELAKYRDANEIVKRQRDSTMTANGELYEKLEILRGTNQAHQKRISDLEQECARNGDTMQSMMLTIKQDTKAIADLKNQVRALLDLNAHYEAQSDKAVAILTDTYVSRPNPAKVSPESLGDALSAFISFLDSLGSTKKGQE